jgi:hypothetical protein
MRLGPLDGQGEGQWRLPRRRLNVEVVGSGGATTFLRYGGAPTVGGGQQRFLRLGRVEGSETGESMDNDRLGRAELTGGRRRWWSGHRRGQGTQGGLGNSLRVLLLERRRREGRAHRVGWQWPFKGR